MLSDLVTNNNNDLTIKNGDLVLHSGEGAKLFALRNYLNTSKEAIAGGSSDYGVPRASSEVISKLALSKCLALGLNMSAVSLLKVGNQFLVNLNVKTKG